MFINKCIRETVKNTYRYIDIYILYKIITISHKTKSMLNLK